MDKRRAQIRKALEIAVIGETGVEFTCAEAALLFRFFDSHAALLEALEAIFPEPQMIFTQLYDGTEMCRWCGEDEPGHTENCPILKARAAIAAAGGEMTDEE